MAEHFASAHSIRHTLVRPVDRLLSFVDGFLRAPLSVGSPLPSSPRLANILFRDVNWEAVENFVEFGPGTGVFTQYALARLPQTAQLFAIDTNPQFIKHLRETMADKRLCAIAGSALDVIKILGQHDVGRADIILSGIPFSTLSDAEARTLIRQSAELLDGDGLFCAYQVRNRILSFLRERFSFVAKRHEWRHLPPYQLYQVNGRDLKL